MNLKPNKQLCSLKKFPVKWERTVEYSFDKSVLYEFNESLKTMTFFMNQFLKEISLQRSYEKIIFLNEDKENKHIEKIKLFLEQTKK